MNRETQSIANKLRKHVYTSDVLEIDGDEFELVPLGSKYLKPLLDAANAGAQGKLDEMYSLSIDLCRAMLKQSLNKPNNMGDEEWNDLVEDFMMANFPKIMEKFYEIHHLGEKDEMVLDKELEELKQQHAENTEKR